MIRREFLQRSVASGAALLSTPQILQAESPPAHQSEIPGPRTGVRVHNGRPMFFVDGQPYSKPVFETYVPETRFFRQFADAGTDVFCFSTNLGRGFGAPAWLGPDEWDFTALDEIAHRVLEANPRGLILPRIYLTTPLWWTDRYPEECQVLAHGGIHYGQGLGHGRDGSAFPSLTSKRWRTDTAAALQNVIRHLQDSDYGDHVFGYIITGLMSEEWYHWSIHSEELSDYSPHATAAFRNWLRLQYQSPEALRKAWNDAQVDFNSATVPSQDARQANRNTRTFRDPASEMPVIDWYRFYNDLIPDTMECFLRAAKEASEFTKAVGAFYCYMFEFGGDPEYGHNALGRLLRSDNLDFAVVTASYHDRALGYGADYARAPITSVGLHGKLWYHDNDTVSFRYDEINQANPDRETVARYRRELGVTESAQETIWQYRRGTGFVMGSGIYESLFDLHGGYFDDPALMAEVKRLIAVLDASRQYPCSSVAEILVVSDEASCNYATFESGFLQQTLQPAQVQLAKLGAPHDSVLADDLALVSLDRYKFVIFLNCFHLTDAQRAAIRQKVLGRERTILWCYAPGLFNGPTTSVEAMGELTGIRLYRGNPAERVRARIALSDAGKTLFSRTEDPALSLIGHEHVWGEPFAVDDPQADILGYIEGSDRAALAIKPLDDWVSLYSLNPVLPAAILRTIARRAGVHIYNDHDDTFYASSNYLCLNADGRGGRTLRLPGPTDLLDPFTGAYLARQSTQFVYEFQDKETLLLMLADAQAETK